LDIIYRYTSILIISLIVYLYFKVIFKVNIDKKARFYYLIVSTLAVGTNLVLLLHSGGIRGLVSIVLYVLCVKYFFYVKTGQAILGVGVVFVVASIGEAITWFILSGMGFEAAEVINNIGLNALSNFITYTVVILFIFLYSVLFYKKEPTSDNEFLIAYIVATLTLIAFVLTYMPKGIDASQATIPLLTTFMAISWLLFFLANKNFSFKKEEKLRLISDIKTIKELNTKLEAEIEQRKKLEEQLSFYATTDSLTNVLNRRTGILFLENRLKEAKRNGQPLTICFIDVDFLKKVNDKYGHNEGDKLIATVSGMLKESLRETDMICRLGGDEFLLIFPNCNKAQAQEVMARVNQMLQQHNDSSGKPYKVSLSYGFAEYGADSPLSVDGLIEVADSEMYEYKKKSGYA